jgi:hypothetical protein
MTGILEFIRGLGFWIKVAIAVLMLGLAWFVVDRVFFAPGRSEVSRVEARGDAIVAEGKKKAQEDAAQVITQNADKAAERAAEGAKADERIRDACNGTAAECGNAGLRELCQRPGARNQPRCVRLFGANPR